MAHSLGNGGICITWSLKSSLLLHVDLSTSQVPMCDVRGIIKASTTVPDADLEPISRSLGIAINRQNAEGVATYAIKSANPGKIDPIPADIHPIHVLALQMQAIERIFEFQVTGGTTFILFDGEGKARPASGGDVAGVARSVCIERAASV
ncbi:MAG: hypothetical protein A2Z16_16000 [Chloroflexi bacterium RBG_16_54_18]|nr:MAG: hypothetical protein A2Z16_16000 [Chloroflexi bacterium RBG_16_54_18]